MVAPIAAWAVPTAGPAAVTTPTCLLRRGGMDAEYGSLPRRSGMEYLEARSAQPRSQDEARVEAESSSAISRIASQKNRALPMAREAIVLLEKEKGVVLEPNVLCVCHSGVASCYVGARPGPIGL